MASLIFQESVDNIKSRITKEDKTNTDILLLYDIPETTSISIGDDITYKDTSGTVIFTGIVQDRTIGMVKSATVYDHGVQGLFRNANQIFTDVSPESIFETVSNDFTDLTFVTTISSGIIIPNYDAISKNIWDVWTEMSELLLGNFRVDKNKNIFLELEGEDASSKAISSSNWVLKGSWKEDKTNLVNSLKVEADDIIQETTESFAGPGTTFTLSQIPIDIKVTVGGTLKTAYVEGSSIGDYMVKKNQKQVIFDVSSSTLVVNYTYRIPINPRRRDAASISMYGQADKVIRVPYIVTRNEARNFADFIVSRFKNPLISGVWINRLLTDYDNFEGFVPNQVIPVNDTIYGVNKNLIIRKVVRNYPGSLEITVGDPDNDIFFYQKEVEKRIKQLENKSENTTIINEDEQIDDLVKLTYTTSIISNKKRGIGSCFYLSEDGAFANSQMLEDGTGPVLCEDESFPDYEGVEPSRTPLRIPFIAGDL
jgi:hypothetical protein